MIGRFASEISANIYSTYYLQSRGNWKSREFHFVTFFCAPRAERGCYVIVLKRWLVTVDVGIHVIESRATLWSHVANHQRQKSFLCLFSLSHPTAIDNVSVDCRKQFRKRRILNLFGHTGGSNRGYVDPHFKESPNSNSELIFHWYFWLTWFIHENTWYRVRNPVKFQISDPTQFGN